MPPERRVLDLAQGRIEYFWHGPTPRVAPALVFLHEGLGSTGLWRDIPEVLAARTGTGALVYSRYGHGGSDPRPLPWPIDFMYLEALEVLPQVLAALALERIVLIGHSDGASIALIHAATRPWPGLGGIVLEAPHLFTEPDGLASIAATRERFRSGDLRARLQRHHGDNVDVVFNGWSGVWLDPDFRDWNLEGLLPAIRVPTLVVQGLADPYGTLAHLRSVERGSSDTVESLTLPEVGHAPHNEAREAYLDRVAAFVARCLD